MEEEKQDKTKVWFLIKIIFKVLLIVLGVALIIVGIPGLVLPVIPGVLLIFLGYFILRGRRKGRKKDTDKKLDEQSF